MGFGVRMVQEFRVLISALSLKGELWSQYNISTMTAGRKKGKLVPAVPFKVVGSECRV